MKLLPHKQILILIVFLVFPGLPSKSLAQGTAFVYQGLLSSGGIRAKGSFDITFTLFGTNVGGTAIAGPITNAATFVSNGVFSVSLDFGEGIFNGNNYWIELAVQTNGGDGFTILEPRQQITPAPYALFTLNAGAAATANAVATNGTVPVTALPNTVVTNGSSAVSFSGTFSGDGSGLSNINASSLSWDGSFLSNNEANPTTFSNGVTFGGYALFGSSNIVIGTNLSFFDGSFGIFQNEPVTIFAPSSLEGGLEIYGDYRNGVSGERYQSGFNPGNPGFHTTGSIAINGDNNIQYIPDSDSMLAIGMDVTNGIVTYAAFPNWQPFQLFCGIGECACPTNAQYPEGEQTFSIMANGDTTIWRRAYSGSGVQLALVQNDLLNTNTFGFDALSNQLWIGPIVGAPATTKAQHDRRSLVMNTNGDVTFGGALLGDGRGLTNLDASQFANGMVALSHLPSAVLTNSSTGVNLKGIFAGDGRGLTNLIFDGPNLAGGNAFTGQQTVTGGYLGIGTNSPQTLLHVYGDSGRQLRLQENKAGEYWDIFTESGLDPGSPSEGNLLFVPGSGTASYIRSSDGAYVTGSDARLKKDIHNLDGVLDRVLQLHPVSYRFESETEKGAKTYGFIAQEVEPLFPEVVGENHGVKGLAYSSLIPVAVGAIQELNQRVQEKDAKLQAQEEEIQQLKQSVAELKEAVSQLAHGKIDGASDNTAASK